jgi:hypothetical protein
VGSTLGPKTNMGAVGIIGAVVANPLLILKITAIDIRRGFLRP